MILIEKDLRLVVVRNTSFILWDAPNTTFDIGIHDALVDGIRSYNYTAMYSWRSITPQSELCWQKTDVAFEKWYGNSRKNKRVLTSWMTISHNSACYWWVLFRVFGAELLVEIVRSGSFIENWVSTSCPKVSPSLPDINRIHIHESSSSSPARRDRQQQWWVTKITLQHTHTHSHQK